MTNLTDLYVIDKANGKIHRVGDDQHDSLWVDRNGVVHYHNLQNGDGCNGGGYAENTMGGYAFLPCGNPPEMYGDFSNPVTCILYGKGVCGYPITDCMSCPAREAYMKEGNSNGS